MRHLLILYFILCTVLVKAQSANTIIPDLLFNRFTSNEGLPDNRIRSVFQDSRGFCGWAP